MTESSRGFTLLELLVVLVILSMTSALLVQGLASTWKNFQRLSSRDLSLSVAQLPQQWFRESIKYALLYHPNEIICRGDLDSFSFVSSAVPSDPFQIPQKLEWLITESDGVWSLAFVAEGEEAVVIKESPQLMQFVYLVDHSWVMEFSPDDSRLPTAIRITQGSESWVLGVPGRPIKADIPAELALFGEYEF